MNDLQSITLEAEQREKLIAELAAYAETDLLCYFAEEEKLYQRQIEVWEPILKWADSEWEIEIIRTQGIMPVVQPPQLKQICHAHLSQYDDPGLIAMAQMVTGLGSVILAIAVRSEAISLEDAITASQLDEAYQTEEWGDDEDIEAKLSETKEKISSAHAYLLTLGDSR